MRIIFVFLTTLICISHVGLAQGDSSTKSIQKIPGKYFSEVNTKIDKYSKRITGKTEKTLTKLSRWENKIKTLLLKTSPATAERLFAPGTPTFSSTLAKYKQGQSIAQNFKSNYNEYRDKFTTSLNFLSENKDALDSNQLIQVVATKTKTSSLNESVNEVEAIEKFIKERKKQLIDESLKHLGKSKYLQKINKESFYYVETLKNYKEIFSDKKKAEETAITILNKIPAFEKFVKSNSMLSSLFRTPDNYGTAQSLAGLQTRASVNALIQDRIAAGGPNARETISQNFQAAQNELSRLKDKIMKGGGSNIQDELPDFKPNMQKTKTFMQRLEFGSNFQFGKTHGFMPANANIGLQAGYKLNEKSTIGLGAAYKLGIGRIDKIKFSHEGVGLRSFIDWKLKKQFYVSGGFEMNHNASFENIAALQLANAWQQSGLIGISKKITVKSKLMNGKKLQFLYDFLWKEQVPVGQQWVFRVGYDIK